MVNQGYTQEEGIDYDDVFAHVAKIEAIRLFLAYASFKDFVVYQMYVKTAFLYGKIKEEKFGFLEVKPTSTPMENQKLLLKDEDGEEVDVHMYRSMIGSLMYLTSSRPDILFAVCACTRYQINPKFKKQTVVANSTREAKYVAASSCRGQVLWIKNQLLDYGNAYTSPHTPTILQPSSSQPQKIQKPRKLIRKDTQVPQPSGPTESVADEAVHKELGDSLVRATTTTSSLEAEQDSGRRIDAIDADKDITLVNDANKEMFDVDDLGGEEVFVSGQNENVVEEVVNAAHDKGKGKMIEEPVKPKKKDQIRLDKEVDKNLEVELTKKNDLQEKKMRKKKEPILP
nr:hypothetical protein [Tanacetum cinerariifolium]